MSKMIEGIPRSTWYYRKKHTPEGLKFTEAARILGITPQSVHRTARRIGVKTAQEVIDYYHSRKITWEIIPDDKPAEPPAIASRKSPIASEGLRVY